MTDLIIEDETTSNKVWTPGYNADQYDPLVIPFRRLHRPTRRADKPISPLLTISDVGIIDALELRALASKDLDLKALLMIVANMMRPEILRDGGWIFYSRDTNHYSQSYVRFYCPKSYTRTYVLRMIDKLREANLIDHETAHASPHSWFRSRFHPKLEFASNLRRLRRRPRRARSQLIVLKDADKRLILVEDSCMVRALRRDVAEQNEALRQYDIQLATDDLSSELLWQYGLDQPYHDFAEDLLYRVFNIDLFHGGRFYGPLWQRLPKWLRYSRT